MLTDKNKDKVLMMMESVKEPRLAQLSEAWNTRLHSSSTASAYLRVTNDPGAWD